MISKSVIVTSRSANFAYFLKDGENCVFYDDAEDFLRQVDLLLEGSDLLDKISRNARKDALKNHCWSHRVKLVLELMSL
jgi:spore maturation protein CgeB